MNHPASQDLKRTPSLIHLLKWRVMISVANDIAFAIYAYYLKCINSRFLFQGAFILTVENNFHHNLLNQSHELE